MPVERVTAVVRPVQDAFGVVELHADARARQGFELRAEVLQQRFDLAPVDIRVDRILEDLAQQVDVLLANWDEFE
jgi:hypothetical protein